MARGTIKRLHADRGFGFITPEEGGLDVFFHQTAVLGLGFAQLCEGQRVEYDLGTDPRNPSRERAVNVRPIED